MGFLVCFHVSSLAPRWGTRLNIRSKRQDDDLMATKLAALDLRFEGVQPEVPAKVLQRGTSSVWQVIHYRVEERRARDSNTSPRLTDSAPTMCGHPSSRAAGVHHPWAHGVHDGSRTVVRTIQENHVRRCCHSNSRSRRSEVVLRRRAQPECPRAENRYHSPAIAHPLHEAEVHEWG